MKHKYILIIFILVVLMLGIFFYFNLQKNANINNNTIKLSNGYKVINSSENNLFISNGTNNITIYYINQSNNLTDVISKYKEEYEEKYDISTLSINGTNEVIKTLAVSKHNNSHKITKYWFEKDKKIYSIQPKNTDSTTENVILEIVNSFK